MATATKAPQKQRPLVIVMSGGAQPWFSYDGLPRHAGEVLPREGANIGLMLEQGLLREVPDSARDLVMTCDCGRMFMDKRYLQTHIERGHDKEAEASQFMPVGSDVIAVEEDKQLVCPPEAHHSLVEDGDGRVVTIWHPDTKPAIPRRRRPTEPPHSER